MVASADPFLALDLVVVGSLLAVVGRVGSLLAVAGSLLAVAGSLLAGPVVAGGSSLAAAVDILLVADSSSRFPYSK